MPKYVIGKEITLYFKILAKKIPSEALLLRGIYSLLV